jgi:hypothetical protein
MGRGLAAFGAFATLAWFLWPEAQWHIHPDALCALIISTAAWLTSLTPVGVRKPTKHDVELLQKFRALIGDSEKWFLRQHDFGGSFSWDSLSVCPGRY